MSGKNKMYKNKIHLTDIDSCRRYLSRVVNQLDEGLIDGQEARDRGYIIKIIADLIKDGELADRLDELEKAVERENQRRSA